MDDNIDIIRKAVATMILRDGCGVLLPRKQDVKEVTDVFDKYNATPMQIVHDEIAVSFNKDDDSAREDFISELNGVCLDIADKAAKSTQLVPYMGVGNA